MGCCFNSSTKDDPDYPKRSSSKKSGPKTNHLNLEKAEGDTKEQPDQKYCFKCKDLSLNENLLIDLDCRTCRICSACAYNYFNECLNPKVYPSCECKILIPYRKFKTYIQEGDLIDYLSIVSEPEFDLPTKFYCKQNHSIVVTKNDEKFVECNQEPGTKYCLSCLEPHNSSLGCIEFYRQNKPKCIICRTKFADPGSPCDCLLCNNCKLEEFKDQLSSDPLKNPRCEVCNQVVIESDLIPLFDGKEKLIKYREDVLLGSKFKCSICYLEKPVDGSITLDCKDRFCKKCIKNHIKAFLNSSAGNESKVLCPICSKDINYHIVTFVLDKFWIDFYEKRLLRNLKRESKEYMKFCNNCDYAAYISIDADEFECPKCNQTICPKCNRISSGTCCREFSLSDIEEFKNTLVRCPECKLGILKENGCNFIKCLWNECKGIIFCFLCKKILSEDEHFSHYKRSGPFGNSCNTTDKIDI